MSKTISEYFSGKNTTKRKPSSTSSVSDSCGSPESNNSKVRQTSKKQRKDSLEGTENTMGVEAVLEEIKQQLVNLATKEDIKEIREDMNRIATRLEAKVDKLESEVFDLRKEQDTVRAELGRLKEENQELRGLVQQYRKEESELRRDQNNHEQHGRQFNVRVYGVAEVQGTRETVDDCAKKCCDIFTARVGVRVSTQDIEIAHRIGKPGGARPRPIIARFFSRALRGQVIADRRKLKQSGVTVGEDLTQLNYKLLQSATQHSATLAAWSSNGKILAKVKNGQTVKLDINMNVNEALTKAMK